MLPNAALPWAWPWPPSCTLNILTSILRRQGRGRHRNNTIFRVGIRPPAGTDRPARPNGPCRAPEGIKEQRRGAGHRRLIGIYDV